MFCFFFSGWFILCVCVCACGRENPQSMGANCWVSKDRQAMQLLGKAHINHTANISSVKHCRCSDAV